MTMRKKMITSFCLAALPLLLPLLGQQQESAPDVWAPFKFFVGQWEGRGEGQGGITHGLQEWEFVLGGKFLQVRNEARFDPQEKNPKGQVHEDWGFISYDRTRKAYVFRQFHIEGFVNQYVCAALEADGKTFVFLSEAIENLPPGFKARLTYRILDENSFEQTFDLAPPGQEMSCYSKGVMTRKGSGAAAEGKKRPLRTSPRYDVRVSLEMGSPFVPDGRNSLAALAFTVLFSPVAFEFDPEEDPLFGRCQVNAEKGKGVFSKLVLNEVQAGEERLPAAFLSARPREFPAGLAIESEPMPADEEAALSGTIPAKVRISFWTEFGPSPITWGSRSGSASLSDFRIVFEVPFRELVRGRPFTAKLPFDGRYPEDKGTWLIDIRPARAPV
jgi:hypothetical protein